MLDRCADIHGRGAFLNGPPARTLRVLLDRHGIEATLAAIDRVPAGIHGPPYFVEALADVLDGGTGEPSTEADDPDLLQRRLAGLKQLMATHEADAGHVPDELQLEYDELLHLVSAHT